MSSHARRAFPRRVALLLAGLLLLTACAQASPAPAFLEEKGYLLAGANAAQAFARNRLALFDASASALNGPLPLTPALTRDLPAARIRRLVRAPDGTLWLGLGGDFGKDDERVLVYSAEGTLLKTLRPCRNPDAGISFAAGRVFIACSENGFAGTLAVLDAARYETVALLSLALEQAPALLVASAADAQTVLITAMTTGPDPQRSYAHLFGVDAQNLTLTVSLPLGADTDVWTILPADGRFYLLNAASARAEAAPRPDVLLFDAATQTLTAQTLPAAAPLWGALHGGKLYAYHHPGWNTTQPQAWRALSVVDLATGQGQSWPLPDGFDAGALAVWKGGGAGLPCLTYASPWVDESAHGLYCLDDAGALTLRVRFPDASGAVLP